MAAALKEYRDGDRAHLTMHSQASSLTDQDIADIVSYFAGKPLTAGSKAEGTVPAPAQLCTSCHGANGVGITPQYPTLAGQHPDYIVRALQEYKKGGRKNPIMAGMAATVKDEDMAIIAEYFSKQRPALTVESRPYTTFGGKEAAGK
jgi:cytochrome c553